MAEILEIEKDESAKELALYHELAALNISFIDNGLGLIQSYEAEIPITQRQYAEFDLNIMKLTDAFDGLIVFEEIEAIESTANANKSAFNSTVVILISTIFIIIISVILTVIISRKLTSSIEQTELLAIGQVAKDMVYGIEKPLDVLSDALDKIVLHSTHVFNDNELENIKNAKISVSKIAKRLKQIKH